MTSAVLEAHGIRYRVHRDVYDPSDDTFLLLEAVQALPRGRLLEVGTGAGLVAVAAGRAGHDVVATDVSATALSLARENARLNRARVQHVRADLLRGVRASGFDAIVFNPPYLPTEPEDRVPSALNGAFDGGPSGLETTRRFLAALPRPLPTVLLVTTSLQPEAEWAQLLRQNGLSSTTLRERPLAHERLRVVRIAATRKG